MPILLLFSAFWTKAKPIIFNKYTLMVIGALALVGGAVLYVHHHTAKAVTAAVTKQDDKATIQSQGTTIQTTQAAAAIDHKYDQQAAVTTKEYDHVRTIVVSAPTASNAADPLLVSTLNALAGMHGSTDSNGVSDSPD